MILKGSVLNHKIKGTKNQSVWHFHCHQQTKCSNAAKAITPPPKKKPTKCYLHLLLPETSSTLLQPPPERPPHQHTLACWSSLKKEEKKKLVWVPHKLQYQHRLQIIYRLQRTVQQQNRSTFNRITVKYLFNLNIWKSIIWLTIHYISHCLASKMTNMTLYHNLGDNCVLNKSFTKIWL